MTVDFPTYADDNGGATAATIREAAVEPSSHTETINGLVTDLSNDRDHVQTAIEGDVADIASANPEAAGQTAQRVARNGYYAIGLINQYADAVEAYDQTVETLNTELHQNTQNRVLAQTYDDNGTSNDESDDAADDLSYNDIKAQEKAKLQNRFDNAKSALEQAETTAVAGFRGGAPTEAEAKELMLAGYLPLASAALWPNLNLSPQESYQAYQAAVSTGTIPNAAAMTEFERQEWMEQNPGLVDQWMQIENPSEEMQAAIIGLQLPRVDSEDAEDDTWRIIHGIENGSYSPGEIQGAFGNLNDINAGLAALAPWAARNNIDLSTNPVVQQSQEYLKTFYAETYSKKEEILEYINSDEHNWEFSYTVSDGTHTDYRSDDGYSDADRDALLTGYADGILNLSNHELGGAYDDLPQELRDDATEVFSTEWMTGGGGYAVEIQNENDDFRALADLLSHSTTEPGDGLAKQMASTAVASMNAHNSFWADTPGGDDVGPWDSDRAADIFDMVSRNRDATADLVSGEDVPGNYPSNFNATVFNEPWDGENGNEGKVAKLYSWMHEDHVNGTDAEREVAERAYNHLASELTSVGEGGNFSTLMREGGDAAGARNPQLVNALLAATTDHWDEFEIQEGKPGSSPLDEASRVRLMSLMASDPDTATRMAGSISIHQSQNADAWASDRDAVRTGLLDLGDRNSRLSTYLDASLINEASERGLDAEEAEAERVQRIKIASGVVATLAGPLSGPAGPVVGPMAGVGNTLLANLLSADHIPDPAPSLDPDWTAQGGHVTTSNGLNVVRALVENEYISQDDIPAVLLDPSTATDAQVRQAVTNLLQEHLPEQQTLYSDFATEVESSYVADLNNLSLRGKDDEKVQAFRGDESWPT